MKIYLANTNGALELDAADLSLLAGLCILLVCLAAFLGGPLHVFQVIGGGLTDLQAWACN